MAPVALVGVKNIAIIDDALAPLSFNEEEGPRVTALLSTIREVEALADFARRGVSEEALTNTPKEAVELLTDPEWPLADAYAHIGDTLPELAERIEERHFVRGMVNVIATKSGCSVRSFSPDDNIQVEDCELVFIDYYLDKGQHNGLRAQRIAKKIEEERNPDFQQQIVLMSSREDVRSFRRAFRKEAGLHGASFSFVAKVDLDSPWKVRAHLEMFARALPHSRAIGEYVKAAMRNIGTAKENLAGILDELDLGDYAYIQKIALESDGHPLGDYLSWLFSSHLTALAFEGPLRDKQGDVDKVQFLSEVVSPSEPSTVVATLYHDALFARNVGGLGPHPRADIEGEAANIPLVALGDVFVDVEYSKAVVVLSADCDLAFAPNGDRAPDRDKPVLIIDGTPRVMRELGAVPADRAIEGMRRGPGGVPCGLAFPEI